MDPGAESGEGCQPFGQKIRMKVAHRLIAGSGTVAALYCE
jgi:hypothetical protein